MKPIIAALTLINTPVEFNLERGPQVPVAKDYDTHLRALNTNAFFGSGGDFAFDLVPVQTPDEEQFAISQAYPNIESPVTTDGGWMLLRDNVGNAAVVLVDGDTTLQELTEGLRDFSQLEIAVGLASDTMGSRLVVAFDQKSVEAFADGSSTYLPAPSLSTRALAVFPERGTAVFPAKEFDAIQGGIWPVDNAAAVSSDGAGPLHMAGRMGTEFSTTSIDADAHAWYPFLELAPPIYVDGGWTLEPAYGDERLREQMQYDHLKAWRQGRSVWMAQNDEGEWMSAEGNITQAIDELGIEIGDFGIGAVPTTIHMD